MKKKFTLRSLESFQAVMQSETLTAAASTLQVSQPVISRFIQDLEKSIGLSLFIREGGRLKPTAEAIVFYEEVQRSMRGVDRLSQCVDMLKNGQATPINLVAAPAIALHSLPVSITQFKKEHPRTRITLLVHSSSKALNMVLDGECDMGVVMLPLSKAGSYGELVLSGKMVCAMPKTHRLAQNETVSPKDLEHEELISFPHIIETRLHLDAIFAAYGIKREALLETQISYALIQFVAAGAGIALVDPITACLHKDDNLHFVPFTPTVANHYSLVVSPKRPTSALRDQLYDHIKTSLLSALPDSLIIHSSD